MRERDTSAGHVTSEIIRVFLASHLLFDTKNPQVHCTVSTGMPETNPARIYCQPLISSCRPAASPTAQPSDGVTVTIRQRRPPLNAAAAGPTQATSPGGSREAMTLRTSSHILPASPPVMRGCTMMRTPLPAYSLPSCMFMG